MFKELMSKPSEELGRWSRFALFQIKVWRYCIRLLRQNRSGTQAAALSFHTVFGLVPLAVVLLMIFQLFPGYKGVWEQVRDFLYEQAQLTQIRYPGQVIEGEEAEVIRLTDQLNELTESYVSGLDTGAITVFGVILIIWASIRLLIEIEGAFNNIWNAPKGRRFLHRIVNYWALLTLGPLLLGVGFYVSTTFFAGKPFQSQWVGWFKPVFPYISSLALMLFMYMAIPNGRVSFRAALWGAAVAALIWAFAKAGFAAYLTRFIPFQVLYGVLGLIPLGLIWIFISWLIILFGLQLTYATQHLHKLDESEFEKMHQGQQFFVANDITIIRIMQWIYSEFLAGAGPVGVDEVSGRLNMPGEFTEKILDLLMDEGLLVKTSEPDVGYIPATEAANISLERLGQVLDDAALGQPEVEQSPLRQIRLAQQAGFAQTSLRSLLEDAQLACDVDRPQSDPSTAKEGS